VRGALTVLLVHAALLRPVECPCGLRVLLLPYLRCPLPLLPVVVIVVVVLVVILGQRGINFVVVCAGTRESGGLGQRAQARARVTRRATVARCTAAN
jgi:hypothetical protein